MKGLKSFLMNFKAVVLNVTIYRSKVGIQEVYSSSSPLKASLHQEEMTIIFPLAVILFL